MDGLTRDNSETIGFVLSSLFCSAIDLQELRDWCSHVIGELDAGAAPPYLFDLMDYNGSLAKIYQVVGFVPSWTQSDEDEDALLGIAAKRGRSRYEWPIDPATAVAVLTSRPDVEARFRQTFPFVDLWAR